MPKHLKRKFATTDCAEQSIQAAFKRDSIPTSLCLTALTLVRVTEKTLASSLV